MNHSLELEAQYGAHNYEPLPVVLVKAKGAEAWDETGKRYIDCMGAYSAVSHGHCHPKLVAALHEQAQTLALTSRAFYSDKLGAFLQKACELTGQEKALPMNTGAEAVETALKAARKWAYTVKGVKPNKAEIIACENNFHGRTIAIISMSSERQYQEGFGPFLTGLRTIRYGDIRELELAITPHTAAFIVEPIQGEGGIIVPPSGYLKKCAELCKKNNVLFIVDEVQTGLGRTGKLLAIDHEEVKPDGVILGKALGGGLLPVSLFLTRKDVMDVFHPGDHGSTFGGYPLAAVVGKRALELLEEENLVAKAAELGSYLKEQLEALDSPVIKQVRGKGLLLGLEINSAYSAHDLSLKLLELSLLTKDTHKTVIRLAPPLMISRELLDEALKIIKQALTEIQKPEPEIVADELLEDMSLVDQPVHQEQPVIEEVQAPAPTAVVEEVQVQQAEVVAELERPKVDEIQPSVEVELEQLKVEEVQAPVAVEPEAPQVEETQPQPEEAKKLEDAP